MKRLMITVAMVLAPLEAFAAMRERSGIERYFSRLLPSVSGLLPASLFLGLVIYAIYALASRDIPGKSKFIWMTVVLAFGFLTPFLAALDPRHTHGWNRVVIGGILLGFMPPLSMFILNQKFKDALRVALAVAMLPFSIVLTILYMAWWIFYGPGPR